MRLNWLPFVLAVLELPPNPRERHFWGRLATLQLIYSLAGLVFGLACIVGGILLFFHGVAGSSSWVGEFIGVQSKPSGAAPGPVLFLPGLVGGEPVAVDEASQLCLGVDPDHDHVVDGTGAVVLVEQRDVDDQDARP